MTRLLAALAALVLVVVLVISRGHHRDAAPATPPNVQPVAAAATTAATAGSATAPGRIKKITPEQRRELEKKIDTARAARVHAGATAPPSLPARHEGGIEDLPPGALDMLNAALPYLGACYGNGARMTGPHRALVLMSMHGDPDVGTLIDPGEMHDENGAAIDPEIASCLTSTLQSLQLPPLGDGNSVQLQFTFRY